MVAQQSIVAVIVLVVAAAFLFLWMRRDREVVDGRKGASRPD